MLPATITLRGIYAAIIALAFAVLLILLGVQTVRLEGCRLWPLSVEGWKPKAQRLQLDIDHIREAQKVAADKARLARLEQERIYREKASQADAQEQKARADSMDAAERFIAANRVRSQAVGGSRGGAGAGGQGNAPQSADRPGSAAELVAGFVAVPEQDIRTCTENTSRLVAAREWALGLND